MTGRTPLVFLLGIAVGVGGTLAVTRREAPPARPRAAIRKPTPAEKAAVKAALDRVQLSEEQRNALYAAGKAISQAKRPMATLPAATVATLRDIHDMLAKIDCTAAGGICEVYRVDVARCFDDAAMILEQRRRDRESIPYNLFQSAVGAYAVNYDTNLHSVFNLAEHCRLLGVAQVEYPPRGAG